jgi:hypothetical protein
MTSDERKSILAKSRIHYAKIHKGAFEQMANGKKLMNMNRRMSSFYAMSSSRQILSRGDISFIIDQKKSIDYIES